MRTRAKGIYCLTAIALGAGGAHDACRIKAHTILSDRKAPFPVLVFCWGTAAVFPEIPGKMRRAVKTAQPRGFANLESLIAQKGFCLFQTDLKQIAFGRGGKKL